MDSSSTHPDTQRSILVVNGPNLNLLGSREPEIYGSETLDEIVRELRTNAEAQGFELHAFQSNSEGEIVDRIQQAAGSVGFILINAAAYTHTSVAIRDALAALGIPYIELHLSNVHSRERFRHRSFLASGAVGVIAGFGSQSYTLALDAAVQYLERNGATEGA